MKPPHFFYRNRVPGRFGLLSLLIITNDKRSPITTSDVANLLFVGTVGPPRQERDPGPYVKTWLGKGRRAAHSTSGMVRQKPKEDSLITMNRCGTLSNNFLYLCCCVVVFNP